MGHFLRIVTSFVLLRPFGNLSLKVNVAKIEKINMIRIFLNNIFSVTLRKRKKIASFLKYLFKNWI